MKSFFKNKKLLIFLVLALATAAILAASVAGTVLLPRAQIMTVSESGTVKDIARSHSSNEWYVGDSQGRILRMGENDEVLDSFSLPSAAAISRLFTDADLDYVVAVDEQLNIYAVSFEDKGGVLVTEGKLSGGCYGLTADENYVYALTSRSRYTAFRKFAKDDFSKTAAQGLLYSSSYLPGAQSWSLVPVYNAEVILMEAVNDSIYLITKGGVGYRISNGFEMNAFDWMSDSELEERFGATMANDGSVTVPRENFKEEQYFCKSFSYATYSAAFDAANENFYIAYANKQLYTVDKDFKELSSEPLGATPGGVMVLHGESRKLYFNYAVTSDIAVCDILEDKIQISSGAGDFDISDLLVTGGGDTLFYLYQDKVNGGGDMSAKILKRYDLHGLTARGTVQTLTIVGFCLAGALGAAAIFAGALCFRPESGKRAKILFGKMKKHWVTYLIVFFSLGALILFTYYPGFSSLFMSFFEYTKERPTFQWNNFGNYAAIFTNPYVGVFFRNLVIFLFSDILLALLPPIIFAVCLVFIRSKKFSTLCRILLYIPGIIPSIASTLIWTNGIYGLDGLLNGIVGLFGGEPTVFLQQENTSVFWLLMMGFPFVGSYLIFYGGLMNIPTSYYEAAELDGCSVCKRIFFIDVPLITPQLKYVFVLTFIASVQNFTRVRLTTDGLYGSQVIMNVLYNYLSEGEYGISAAYGAIMFVILMVATLVNLRLKTVDAEG